MHEMSNLRKALIGITWGAGALVFILNLTISLLAHGDDATIWRQAAFMGAVILIVVGLAVMVDGHIISRPQVVYADRETLQSLRRPSAAKPLDTSDLDVVAAQVREHLQQRGEADASPSEIKRAKAERYVEMLSGVRIRRRRI